MTFKNRRLLFVILGSNSLLTVSPMGRLDLLRKAARFRCWRTLFGLLLAVSLAGAVAAQSGPASEAEALDVESSLRKLAEGSLPTQADGSLPTQADGSLPTQADGSLPNKASSGPAGSPSVDKLRLWHSPRSTRVVFDVSAGVKHSVFSLTKPNRIVVDIDDSSLVAKLPSIDPSNAHIATIRTGQPQAGVLRFVFELKKALKQNSFVLSPNELYGHRLVLDLEDPKASGITASETPDSANSSEPGTETKLATIAEPAGKVQRPLPKSQAEIRQLEPQFRQLIVAIDAGHGGEDPGATGHRGSREKQLTLAIARRLKKVIDADPRMRATLIRTGDYYIKLDQRRIMARKQGADVFISIHADAFRKRSARGFSVFALSQRGATSTMASTLAAKENASDSIGGVSLADKDEVLAKVLVDLSITNTISESVNLGGRVLKELSKLGRLHSSRVEQAGFAVLKTPDMPSILVETGFITNPEEERNLRSPQYQQKIALAIHSAIDQYAKQTPYLNKGSYAAPRVGNTRSVASARSGSSANRPKYHKIVRGDSLSKIAQRYGVRLSALKKENKLKSNVAVLGRRLKLPGNAKSVVNRSAQGTARPAVHLVQRGDSLSKISARYNITINALKKFNKLKKNTVFLGQRIKLPGGKTALVRSAPRNVAPIKHKVKRGDTLSEIAEKYRSSIKAIMRANKLRNRNIQLGQILTIPS